MEFQMITLGLEWLNSIKLDSALLISWGKIKFRPYLQEHHSLVPLYVLKGDHLLLLF